MVLGRGPADAALAPERLAELEGRYHVYLEVLDRGGDETEACVRITRPPAPGPWVMRCATALERLLGRRAGRRDQ